MEEFQYKKFSSIFANYQYIFILQHNNIKTEDWKKIKRALGNVSLHKIPKKLRLFGKEQFSAPLCFLGCESPEKFKLLEKTLKEKKLPEHTLLVLGLYLRNNHEFTFYNSLDIEKILEAPQFASLYQILQPSLDLKTVQAQFLQIMQCGLQTAPTLLGLKG